MQHPLTGIIPPLVTPRKDRETLDAAGLERVIEYVLDGGVHGLFVLGRNRTRTHEWQAVVMQVTGRPYHIGQHASAVINGIKCALSCLRICGDFMTEPLHRFREPERKLIEQGAELAEQVQGALSP